MIASLTKITRNLGVGAALMLVCVLGACGSTPAASSTHPDSRQPSGTDSTSGGSIDRVPVLSYTERLTHGSRRVTIVFTSPQLFSFSVTDGTFFLIRGSTVDVCGPSKAAVDAMGYVNDSPPVNASPHYCEEAVSAIKVKSTYQVLVDQYVNPRSGRSVLRTFYKGMHPAPGMTIAGVPSDCQRGTFDLDSKSSLVCTTHTGQFLALATDGDVHEYELTALHDVPAAGQFTLPAGVQVEKVDVSALDQ